MKKLIILALVIMAGASFNISNAGNKGSKKKKNVVKEEVISPKTQADSLSYAAGKASTDGLISFLQQEYQLDTAYMADFITGFKDALQRSGDPQYKAYNAGAQIARMVNERILPGVQSRFEGTRDSITSDMFTLGFVSSLSGDTTIYTQERAQEVFETRMKAAIEEATMAWKSQNEQWLADNKTKEGVKTTASGLQYKVIRAGSGAVAKSEDKVTVKYEGKLIDGTVFDSSYKRNPQTTTFRCDQVIKGWTEALTMMPEGSKWELYIPQQLAYSDRPAGEIKPFSTLIFTVEVESIEAAQPAAQPAEQPAKKPVAKTRK